jgi:hypothetical protein
MLVALVRGRVVLVFATAAVIPPPFHIVSVSHSFRFYFVTV